MRIRSSRAARTGLWILPFAMGALVMGTSSTASAFKRWTPPDQLGQPRHDLKVAAGVQTSGAMAYYGGHVISHVQIVVVEWGTGVPTEATQYVDAFYQKLVNSSFMDWMGEYDTVGVQAQDGQPGTTQHVNRGTFLSHVKITPANTATDLSDTDLGAELASQIKAGKLPTPTVDSEGGVNTLYALYFPKGVTVSDSGGTPSCNSPNIGQNGAFCGYHSSFGATIGGKTVQVPYSIQVDMTNAQCSGCQGSSCGCGGDPSLKSTLSIAAQEYMITASHELAEAMTDTETGVGNQVKRPLAWYYAANDPNAPQGEVGDICATGDPSTEQVKFGTFVVQRIFSQAQQACVGPDDVTLPNCTGSNRPCHPVCASNSDCSATPTTPVCDTTQGSANVGSCVECVASADCKTATKPTCDKTSNTCKACASNSDCSGATPACVTSGSNAGACVGCVVDGDCTNGGTCNTTNNTCNAPSGSSSGGSGSGSSSGDNGSGSGSGSGSSSGDNGNGNGDNGGTGSSGGCAAAPGSSANGFAIAGVMLGLAAAMRRRRRR